MTMSEKDSNTEGTVTSTTESAPKSESDRNLNSDSNKDRVTSTTVDAGPTVADDDDDSDDLIEYTILAKRDVNAYQVPPRTSASGYRAEEWKTPIWAGKIWVVGKGQDSIVRLINASTNELFLQSIIENGEHEKFVERTVDSSRYFVVRVVHPKTKKVAFIGFGFEDRNDAFDFNCCLSDFKDSISGPKQVDPTIRDAINRDFTLKEGEKIQINLDKVMNKKKNSSESSSANSNNLNQESPNDTTSSSKNSNTIAPSQGSPSDSNTTGFSLPPPPSESSFALPPPPAGGGTRSKVVKDSADSPKNNQTKKDNDSDDPFAGDDDFFGDFQSA